MTYEITLHGHDQARFPERNWAATGRSPVAKLARMILQTGGDPSVMVRVSRDGREAFKPVPLSVWADLTVAEGARSIRFVKYVQFNAEE